MDCYDSYFVGVLCISAHETKVRFGRDPEPMLTLTVDCSVSFKHVFNSWCTSWSDLLRLGPLIPFLPHFCCICIWVSSAVTEYQLVARQSVCVGSLHRTRFHLAGQECGTCQITQQVIWRAGRRCSKKDNMSAPVSVWRGGKIPVLSEELHIRWSVYSA